MIITQKNLTKLIVTWKATRIAISGNRLLRPLPLNQSMVATWPNGPADVKYSYIYQFKIPSIMFTRINSSHVLICFQMIWEQGSAVIVNLTNLSENDISLCHQYWPEYSVDCYHIYEVRITCILWEIYKESREGRAGRRWIIKRARRRQVARAFNSIICDTVIYFRIFPILLGQIYCNNNKHKYFMQQTLVSPNRGAY